MPVVLTRGGGSVTEVTGYQAGDLNSDGLVIDDGQAELNVIPLTDKAFDNITTMLPSTFQQYLEDAFG